MGKKYVRVRRLRLRCVVQNEINEVDSSLQERYNFLEKQINNERGFYDYITTSIPDEIPYNLGPYDTLRCSDPEGVERLRDEARSILRQTSPYLFEEPNEEDWDEYEREVLVKGRRR